MGQIDNNGKEAMTYMRRPTTRPKQAPIAMVGKNIPAGIRSPNVHAVRTILATAVKVKRKTFAQKAVGL